MPGDVNDVQGAVGCAVEKPRNVSRWAGIWIFGTWETSSGVRLPSAQAEVQEVLGDTWASAKHKYPWQLLWCLWLLDWTLLRNGVGAWHGPYATSLKRKQAWTRMKATGKGRR